MCMRLAKAKKSLLLFNCQDSILKREYPKYGGVAQLGEHLPCKQGVMGSIPIISTNFQATMQSVVD